MLYAVSRDQAVNLDNDDNETNLELILYADELIIMNDPLGKGGANYDDRDDYDDLTGAIVVKLLSICFHDGFFNT